MILDLTTDETALVLDMVIEILNGHEEDYTTKERKLAQSIHDMIVLDYQNKSK